MQEAPGHSARHQQRGKGSVHEFLVSELPRDWWILNNFITENSPEAEMVDTGPAGKGTDPSTINPQSLRAASSSCCGFSEATEDPVWAAREVLQGHFVQQDHFSPQ